MKAMKKKYKMMMMMNNADLIMMNLLYFVCFVMKTDVASVWFLLLN